MSCKIRFIKDCDEGKRGEVKKYSKDSAKSLVIKGLVEIVEKEKMFMEKVFDEATKISKENKGKFSYFNPPITNTILNKNISVEEFYNEVKSDTHKKTIERIRAAKTIKEKRELKSSLLPYVTFGGRFPTRSKEGLLHGSGLASFDIDGLFIEEKQNQIQLLKKNPYIELLITSPSGEGLKLIIKIPIVESDYKYKEYFFGFLKYLKSISGISNIDTGCKDICRACFLSYDPEAYYNPDSKIWEEKGKVDEEIKKEATSTTAPKYCGFMENVACKIPLKTINPGITIHSHIDMNAGIYLKNKPKLFSEYKQQQNRNDSAFNGADKCSFNCGAIHKYLKENQIQAGINECQECPLFKEKMEKINVKLPKQGILISTFINSIIETLSKKHTLFYRSDSRQIVEVGKVVAGEKKKTFTGFLGVKPSRFITLVEKFFTPGNDIAVKKEDFFYFEFKEKSMTKDLANTVLNSYILEDNLPNIDRIFTIPIPIIYEEKLTFPKKGYDERFNSWLPYNAPEINNKELCLEDAKKILKEILGDFCFQTENDYNMAIAGLITPFLRGLYSDFTSRTPVFIYLGNRERVGKDYLANIGGLLYEGVAIEEPPISISGKRGNNDDELRKKILSAFLGGRKRLHFSNNKGFINNSVFEGVVTAKTYSDRMLGKNELVMFDNELEFSLSGNKGIGFTPDLANRSRFINLFYDKENTNKRVFKNPMLHRWILNNRSLILSAIYTLIKNWVEKGSPDGKEMFASFPEWARVCGGIMECNGYDSPCNVDNMGLGLGVDLETEDMKNLFEICWEKSPDTPINKKEIRELILDEDIMGYYNFEKKEDQTKFGTKITRFIGRVLSDIRMSVVDGNVRAARQKYVFKKEVNTYEKDKGGNVGNVGNLVPISQYNNIIVDNRVGKTLPTLPRLPKHKTTDIKHKHKTSKNPKLKQISGLFIISNIEDLLLLIKHFEEKNGKAETNIIIEKTGDCKKTEMLIEKALTDGDIFESGNGVLKVL